MKMLRLAEMADKIGEQNDALVDAELFEFSEPPETHPVVGDN